MCAPPRLEVRLVSARLRVAASRSSSCVARDCARAFLAQATGLSRDNPQHVALRLKARLKLEEHKLRGARASSSAHKSLCAPAGIEPPWPWHLHTTPILLSSQPSPHSPALQGLGYLPIPQSLRVPPALPSFDRVRCVVCRCAVMSARPCAASSGSGRGSAVVR